jgi:hypothetical protein
MDPVRTIKTVKTTRLSDYTGVRSACIVRGLYKLSLCVHFYKGNSNVLSGYSGETSNCYVRYVTLDKFSFVSEGDVILPEEYKYVKIMKKNVLENGKVIESFMIAHVDAKHLKL